MQRFLPLVGVSLLLGLSLESRGGEDPFARARKELQPRKIDLKDMALPVNELLVKLEEQTGNRVLDRRQDKKQIKLKLGDVEFWPALQAIAKESGCGISLYQPDGHIALVDLPQGPAPSCVSGSFRINVKRIGVVQDFETKAKTCVVTLEVAWEPRLQPLYLGVGSIEATLPGGASVKIPSGGQMKVAGRSAVEVDVRFAAPPRAVAKIAQLEGRLHLLTPARMLTFSFTDLESIQKAGKVLETAQQGVKVSVRKLKTASKNWFVSVAIDNPAGGPSFESFQERDWIFNNVIALEKGEGPEKQLWTGKESASDDNPVTARHAAINYFFPVQPDQAPGNPADWRLIYRTPGPMVEVAVPFTFKDLPLP